MVTDTQVDIRRMVERWVRHELPLLNRGVEAHGDVNFLIHDCQIRMDAIAHAASDVRDPELAMRLLQLAGFAVSSVERHLQISGVPPGEGVSVLRAGPVLTRLGQVAGHIPRDSHYTYWLLNFGDEPLTFTGASEESKLIRTLAETHHLQSASAAMLRPVCQGDVAIARRHAVDSMEFAAGNHDRITMLLHSLLAPSAPRPRIMPFETFAAFIRTYLLDYPVGMQSFPSPNPGNMTGAMMMEMIIGAPADRVAQLRHRMPFLMQEDRAQVESMMDQPSLASRLIEAAGMTEQELDSMLDRDMTDRLARLPGLRDSLVSFAHLVNAAMTSASYFSAVEESLGASMAAASRCLSGAKTLLQRDSEYDTIPQLLGRTIPSPAARRLVAVVGKAA